jgi:molybdopterin converting factor small subunit
MNINITITMFGAFRAVGDGAPLLLQVPQATSVAALRGLIVAQLQKQYPGFTQHSLVAESAIADAQQILADDAQINADAELALLPPVCGG